MSELIEKVARSMVDEVHRQWTGARDIALPWDEASEDYKEQARIAARAAIVAMTPPIADEIAEDVLRELLRRYVQQETDHGHDPESNDDYAAACIKIGEQMARELLRLRARERERRWRKIETAPKDGTEIIFGHELPWWTSGNVVIGFWHEGQDTPGWQASGSGLRILSAHWPHWRPLPPPPPAASEG